MADVTVYDLDLRPNGSYHGDPIRAAVIVPDQSPIESSLLRAVSLTLLLQLAIIYVPFFQALFKTRPLTMVDLLLTIALSSAVFAAVEIEKMVKRNRSGLISSGPAV